MRLPTDRQSNRNVLCMGAIITLAAAGIALLSARPYAGSWNDGCRLAPVETLVDYHTLAIDNSIFVQVPQPRHAAEPTPYPPADGNLMKNGTLDKLYIAGKFYSDKPPVLSVLLAAVYQVWQWFGGPAARERPDLFCYLMTVVSSGIGYVIAVLCTYRLNLSLGLPLRINLLLVLSFALCTFSLAYMRHVNSHVLLLGVMSALLLNLRCLSDDGPALPRLIVIGMLAGFAYALDLGIGPVLLMCLAGLLLYRRPKVTTAICFGLATLPWLLAHHALNYAIGGTFKPANTLVEYHQWPGCPFDAADLTGRWNHSPWHFVVYSLALLFGKHGFVGHNLPLFLTFVAAFLLLRRRRQDTPEILFSLALCGGSWLIYAAFSTNYAGVCCSIRWFVPLLAPGFYLLALLLRDRPTYRWDFAVLSASGAVLAAIMWWYGPWIPHMVPWFWQIQACALVSWWGVRIWRRQREASDAQTPEAPCIASGLGREAA